MAAPGDCPVCHRQLDISGLKCAGCGTELRGHFKRCEFCHLDDSQRDLLLVFLKARGNTKELERHLGVSYPTARARLDDLLGALDIAPAEEQYRRRREVLHAVANGEMDIEDAIGVLH